MSRDVQCFHPALDLRAAMTAGSAVAAAPPAPGLRGRLAAGTTHAKLRLLLLALLAMTALWGGAAAWWHDGRAIRRPGESAAAR